MAAQKFKKRRASETVKNEIWCMDLAFDDKLAKNNDVKLLPVRQDLLDRTVDAKLMKTKDSEETIGAFSTTITKQNSPKKIWVDKGTKFVGKYEKFVMPKKYTYTLH